MNIVLISTYELGHQPFGLASPAAWLRARGHTVVTLDVSVEKATPDVIRAAEVVAFYVPMHTATRIAAPLVGRVRELNPAAAICAYGLYAPLAESYLRELGVTAFFGGEFERALADFADSISATVSKTSLERLSFLTPDRSTLPPLSQYGQLVTVDGKRVAGYTEASRGCKHRCRHCPVVPVYDGAFRVVQAEVVLEDIAAQLDAGAQHITFGDPDFFNGPAHARRILEEMHRRFPSLSYDVTIKIEHLLRHSALLKTLHDTGCAFVTSAVESLDDAVLARLEKGHTRADFLRAVELFRQNELVLAPTFIPFTPWTTGGGYKDLLRTIAAYDLIDNVAPVQLTLRLLVPHNSRLLELDDIRQAVTTYDSESLVWRWSHSDPAVDDLSHKTVAIVNAAVRGNATRRSTFSQLWALLHDSKLPENFDLLPRTTIPYMEEPWFC